MRVLAVNTASGRLSFALADGADGQPDASLVFAADIEEPRDQGNFLLHTIDSGLKEHGLNYGDIDLMVAVTGPGSFTGIRIGLAVLHGFSLAANVPLAGINSFDLFRATVPVKTPHSLTVMESWRDELYFQLDDAEPFNVTPQECVAFLKDIVAQDLTLLGDATVKMQNLVPPANVNATVPDAASLARLMIASPKWRQGDATPFYLRPPDVSFGQGNRKIRT